MRGIWCWLFWAHYLTANYMEETSPCVTHTQFHSHPQHPQAKQLHRQLEADNDNLGTFISGNWPPHWSLQYFLRLHRLAASGLVGTAWTEAGARVVGGNGTPTAATIKEACELALKLSLIRRIFDTRLQKERENQ
jgi:hypothetical protein